MNRRQFHGFFRSLVLFLRNTLSPPPHPPTNPPPLSSLLLNLDSATVGFLPLITPLQFLTQLDLDMTLDLLPNFLSVYVRLPKV